MDVNVLSQLSLAGKHLWLRAAQDTCIQCSSSTQPAAESGCTPADCNWASLPQDLLWQLLQRAGEGAFEGLDNYTPYCQLLASCVSVCRSWRTALLSPDSGVWDVTVLSSSHPGLTAQQSRGLNAMLAAQGHLAYSLILHGGAWELQELAKVTSSLTALSCDLVLLRIDSADEAAVISSTLSARPVRAVCFHGTAACVLPSSARHVDLRVAVPGLKQVGQFVDQAPLKPFLSCLRPLRDLQVLELRLHPWKLTEEAVDSFISHLPSLTTLHLELVAAKHLGDQDLRCLRKLTSMELSLTLIDGMNPAGLAQMLWQAQGLQLAALTLHSPGLNVFEEALLSECRVELLILRFPDPALRLQKLPPGARVIHHTLELSDCSPLWAVLTKQT